MTSKHSASITVLGGGPAGLAVGYYAKKKGLSFRIYEAQKRLGGNAITLQHGDFLFDSGAHRLHDKHPEITQEVLNLLGSDIKKIEVPSQIYHEKRFIDFPLSPLNLFLCLGPIRFIKAIIAFLKAKLSKTQATHHFEGLAIKSYGYDIASRFLLNYSEKLWGLPCNRLSPSVAGRRIKGLNLKTFIKEALFGRKAKTAHLDGSFYYPTYGIGMIANKLGEFCGKENIRTEARITKIKHENNRIKKIEINGSETVSVEEVVSTLPATLFLKLMHPAPPSSILAVAGTLRFRNVKLVTLFINKPSITRNGSIYFPDTDHVFTRVYEPRNRSPFMAPPGQTSLVAEIPCQPEDDLWQSKDQDVIQKVQASYEAIGWIKRNDVIGAQVHDIPFAYPVLELGCEEKIQQINDYLMTFENLKITGRSGKFMYTHIHDMMLFGKEIIEEEFANKTSGSPLHPVEA